MAKTAAAGCRQRLRRRRCAADCIWKFGVVLGCDVRSEEAMRRRAVATGLSQRLGPITENLEQYGAIALRHKAGIGGSNAIGGKSGLDGLRSWRKHGVCRRAVGVIGRCCIRHFTSRRCVPVRLHVERLPDRLNTNCCLMSACHAAASHETLLRAVSSNLSGRVACLARPTPRSNA